MNLTGNAKGKTIQGTINDLKTLHGYSAYEIAVINGFEGTEEEWLESLKGANDETVATKEYVKNEIANINPENIDIDLSDYATKDYVDGDINLVYEEIDKVKSQLGLHTSELTDLNNTLNNHDAQFTAHRNRLAEVETSTSDLRNDVDSHTESIIDCRNVADEARNVTSAMEDYIIDRGETEINGVTWYWEKWNSGKAECWCQADYSNVKFTTAWGSLFTADTKFGGIQYPFEFATVPQEYRTLIRSEALCFIAMHADFGTTTTSSQFTLLRATAVDFGYSVSIGIKAIGRWE